jgi:hypothetical protein
MEDALNHNKGMNEMTGELIGEDRIALNELARELAVDYSTVRRWMLSGYQGVRLASLRIGRKRYTTRQAVAPFFLAAINHEPEITGAAN